MEKNLEKRKNKFLSDAIQIHGTKYDYSKVDFINYATKVTLICKIEGHGEFQATPGHHIQGSTGCPKCYGNPKGNTDLFISRSKLVHEDLYTYDEVDYINTYTKVIIGCRKHGNFEQSPKKHLSGQGCPTCGKRLVHDLRKVGIDKFIEDSKVTHNNQYDYSKVSFNLLSESITIICPKHGEFTQTAINHRSGAGCVECFNDRRHLNTGSNKEEFITKAKLIHINKDYDYSLVEYVSAKIPVKITCTKHGVFEQTPDVHLGGSGCKSCSHTISNAQVEIEEFVKSLGVSVVRDYVLENGKHIDVYCPEFKLGFEYNGLRFHGEFFRDKNYHLDKSSQANAEGISIVHIWEDEWIFHKEKIKNLIKIKTNKITDKYNARECTVKKLDWTTTSEFLNTYHLQSTCAPTKYSYGLYKGETLLSVMCFTKSTTKDYAQIELIRFSSKGIVRGGFSKLLSYFVRSLDEPLNSIVSFSDRRFSEGLIYKSAGFTKVDTLPPNYVWCKRNERFHRRGFQHKYLQNKLEFYDPEKTEVENCHNNGYFRIWDCGLDKWQLNFK